MCSATNEQSGLSFTVTKGLTDEHTVQITEIRRRVDSSPTTLKMETATSSETSIMLTINMA
jgi:hypothetical protein